MLERLRSTILDCVAAQAGRLVLFLPVAGGAGILLYFSLRREPPLWLCAVLVVVPLLGVLLTWRKLVLRGFMALLLVGGLGFGRAAWQTDLEPALMAAPHQAVGISGRISAIDLLATGRRIRIKHPSFDGGKAQARVVRVKLRANDDVALESGDSVRLRALLYGSEPASYPGAWNFGRDQFYQGLGAVGFALGGAEVTA